MNPVRDNAYFVYILRNAESGQLYTGYTSNLRKRLAEHHAGKVGYTNGRGHYELVYYEACANSNDASARERYLKSGMGKRYLKNRLKRFLALTG